MTKTDICAWANEATLPFTDPLAGVDWCWVKTTNHVATNLPIVFALRVGEQPSTRVERGLAFAFARHDDLLKRLAD